MATQNNITIVDTPSFTSSRLDLDKLVKELAKHQKDAVERLAALMKSVDEKIALAAAKSLIEMSVELKKTVNTDQLQRLIAEYKIGTGKRSLEDISVDNKPMVDFDSIREID